jgi:hypothetical protein
MVMNGQMLAIRRTDDQAISNWKAAEPISKYGLKNTSAQPRITE